MQIGLQVVEQHIATGGEIAHVEGVASAEAETRACSGTDAGSEFLPPQQQGVVEAESKQDRLVGRPLGFCAGPALAQHLLSMLDGERTTVYAMNDHP